MALFNKKRKVTVSDEYWKGVKDVVDQIFETTFKERDQMTANLRQFVGDIWDKEKLQEWESAIKVNLLFTTVENIAPMLSDNKPVVSLIPHAPYLERLAWSYNSAIKYIWDETDMQMLLMKGAVCHMVMKVAIYEVTPDREKDGSGMFGMNLVDPRDFFLLPGYDEIWKAPMCGVRQVVPISWIRKHFPEIKKITPTSGVLGGEGDKGKSRRYKYGEAIDSDTFMDFEAESYFATVYRVWMRDEMTMVEFIKKDEKGNDLLDSDGEPVTQRKPAYPYGKMLYFTENEFLGIVPCKDQHSLPPWVEQKDYLVPFNFLGMGENDQLEGLNKEFQLQLQYAVGHTRRAHDPNIEVDTGQQVTVADVESRHRLGGQVFATDSQYSKTKEAIRYIPHPPLDRTTPELLRLLPTFAEEVTGDREITKGNAMKKERQSASEIAMALESAHTRTRGKVRNQDWTIKRIVYLWVRSMQQYWTDERTIFFQKDGEVIYENFSSAKAFIEEKLAPQVDDLTTAMEQYRSKSEEERKRDMEPAKREQMQDYMLFLQNFHETKELDPVFFDFTIDIQTDSTLPVDKQSRANLAMRLFSIKAIDRRALLEILQWPGYEDILKRIEDEQEKAMAARASAGGGIPGRSMPGRPSGGSPLQLAAGGK